ncbi:MAG TPA: MmgE/PrpD family protein [Candidatus Binatia bacterium]
MRADSTIAESLAAYIHDLNYGDLPPEVVERLKELLLDQLGCEVIGSTVEWNQPVYRFVRENKHGGAATVVNYGDRVPLDDAALVNGTFGQGCELDDYYDQGGGHPGASTVPVGMALAQRQPISGKQFLAALAAGYEIGWRVGRALLPEMMRRGYHAQGVVGVFVSATAAVKLLALDRTKITHALAIAGSHASGTMEYDQSGGEVKRAHNGMACCGGLRSAMLAEMGLTGPPTIFEGERGILRVFSGKCDTEPLIKKLGSEFAVMHAAVKRFPVNASQHSPIELLEKLIQEHRIRPADIRTIEVGVNEAVILHGGSIVAPMEVIQAQFSLRFSLAVRLLRGSNDLKFYLDPATWHAPDILDTVRKITLFADPAAQAKRRFACTMQITLADGRVLVGAVDAPKGTSANPLTHAEIREKFFRLGSSALPQAQLERIAARVESLEEENDVSVVASLLINKPATA